MNWNIKQLAYLAGIIDADGCISIGRTGKLPRRDFNVRMYVMCTDKNLINWLHQTFGGLTYSRKRENIKWKIRYEWFAERKTLDILLPKLIPFLIIKKDRAKIAFEFRKTFAKRQSPLPKDVRTFREKCFHKLKSLNSRGQ